MIARRNFLTGLAGIFAAAAAPAIIHNAMKISVAQDPNRRLIQQAMAELEALGNRTIMMYDQEPEPAIKAYIDRHYQQPPEHLLGRRGPTVMDTSRGLYTYRLPLHAGKSEQIMLVPHDERVLRFA